MKLIEYFSEYLPDITYQIYNNDNLFSKDAIKMYSDKDILCFLSSEKKICIRLSHTTPTKLGQFVTLYKRYAGKIIPLNISDIEYLIIVYTEPNLHGMFIMNQQMLLLQNIISHKQIDINREYGKLSFRIYHPSCMLNSKQAITSQKWQQSTFYDYPLCIQKIKEII